jgi:NAD(P)-dependent dehydrogenase (short-subunit alcohol dehydrogenase family)
MSRVWMLTGASRGVGAKIAESVLARGDSIAVTACRRETLTFGGDSARVLRLKMDVNDERQAITAVAAAHAEFGKIDVLVNMLGAVEEFDAMEVEETFRMNIFGLLNITRAVLPGMRQRRAGHIMNLLSPGEWGAYGVTKFAVGGLSEALRDQLATFGIRVTVVEPELYKADFLDPKSMNNMPPETRDCAGTLSSLTLSPLGTAINSRLMVRSLLRCLSGLWDFRSRLCDGKQIATP